MRGGGAKENEKIIYFWYHNIMALSEIRKININIQVIGLIQYNVATSCLYLARSAIEFCLNLFADLTKPVKQQTPPRKLNTAVPLET